MSDISTELNLALAVDDDDTADYLTKPAGLYGSLQTIDGLFNSSTGHNHNGAHQGGQLQFQNLNVAQDLTVVGQSNLQGPVLASSTLHVVGAVTLDGSVTLVNLDSLFAGTRASPSADYTIAANVMYVFAQAAMTVTFPAAASTNRPITVAAVSGQVTLAGGTFIGGSINLASGAVQNGIIITGDAITYRSDGTSWRAV